MNDESNSPQARMNAHYQSVMQKLLLNAERDLRLARAQAKAAEAASTGLGFTPHIRGKRPNVLCFTAFQVRAAQPRIFFYSLCSEKQFGYPNYFSKPYKSQARYDTLYAALEIYAATHKWAYGQRPWPRPQGQRP